MRTKTILALSSAMLLAACGTVDNGTRGIVKTYGQATDVMGEGFYWYNPWSTDVVDISVQQQRWTNKTSAYTKDVQKATIEFVMTFHLSDGAVLNTYKKVGLDWGNQIVPQVVYQSIKNATGQARAVEDAINNRSAITDRIRDDISKVLLKRGIIVDGFDITDISFEPAFEEAVERKQVAVQNAEAEKNKTVQIQEQANQRVIAANADAEAMRIKTAALAGNAKLVEYEAVQKWDGVLPTNMYGGSMPFIKIQ